MLQLTALIFCRLVSSGEQFILSLDRVLIAEEDVPGAVLSVHDFVRSPQFTQKNFFFDSGFAMLAESAAIFDSITTRSAFEPWSLVETASRSQVVAEFCACVNRAVDRRWAVKDSQEQWYAVGGVRPSSDDSAFRSGMRVSNVVEEGRVEYVPVSGSPLSAPGPSSMLPSLGKSKKKKVSSSLLSFLGASKLQVLRSPTAREHWSKIPVLVQQ